MKKNRTFLHILVLSLALVVFLTFAACKGEGEAATTGTGITTGATDVDPATDPATDPTTEPGTTATEPGTTATEPGTTATEPATTATEPGTTATEPGTTATEPATTEPATTEPATTVPIDYSKPINGIASSFFPTLPEEFTAENVIFVPSSVIESGASAEQKATAKKSDQTEIPSHYWLTKPENADSNAHGVSKLLASEDLNGDGKKECVENEVWHYYLDEGTGISYSESYIRYSFTVTEAGTYKIASHHRKRTDARNGFIRIDNNHRLPIAMVAMNNVTPVDNASVYFVWNQYFYFEAGEHTITYTMESGASIHWRDLWLLRVGGADFVPPVEEATDPTVATGLIDTSWYDATKTEFVLTTADQLVGYFALRKTKTTFEGMTIKLGADLTLNQGTVAEFLEKPTTVQPVLGTGYNFMGTFDGQGHTINGICQMPDDGGQRGIFGPLSGNAVIKNLTIANSYMGTSKGASKINLGFVASKVVGDGSNVTLSNITVADSCVFTETNNVAVSIAGGFVGVVEANNTLTIDNCSFNGTMSFANSHTVGGFVGKIASSATLVIYNNCTFGGTLTCNDAEGRFSNFLGSNSAFELTAVPTTESEPEA